MRKFLTLLSALIGLSASPATSLAAFNYDEMILLDAENLAETGIKEGFQQVLVSLKKHVSEPVGVKELINNKLPSYSVKSMGVVYEIYSPKTPENESWGNATFALFSIVNQQLKNSNYRFYAFYSGNDLGGMFLTEKQYKQAISSIKNKIHWPYIPTQSKPWYGQPH